MVKIKGEEEEKLMKDVIKKNIEKIGKKEMKKGEIMKKKGKIMLDFIV